MHWKTTAKNNTNQHTKQPKTIQSEREGKGYLRVTRLSPSCTGGFMEHSVSLRGALEGKGGRERRADTARKSVRLDNEHNPDPRRSANPSTRTTEEVAPVHGLI